MILVVTKEWEKVLKNIQEEALGATPGPGEGEGLSGQATKMKEQSLQGNLWRNFKDNNKY